MNNQAPGLTVYIYSEKFNVHVQNFSPKRNTKLLSLLNIFRIFFFTLKFEKTPRIDNLNYTTRNWFQQVDTTNEEGGEEALSSLSLFNNNFTFPIGE